MLNERFKQLQIEQKNLILNENFGYENLISNIKIAQILMQKRIILIQSPNIEIV